MNDRPEQSLPNEPLAREPLAFLPFEAPDESTRLRWALVFELDDVRRGLQKWHAAVRRVSGSAASDILRGQGRVLSMLDAHGEMSQRALAEEYGVRPQSVAEIVDKLERAGYVTRRACAHDSRVKLVSITEAGRTCVRNRQETTTFDCFTDEEVRQLLEYLQRIIDSIDDDCAQMALRPAHGCAASEEDPSDR